VRVLVLQHIACEPPGAYEDVLLDRGALLTRVELDDGEALPALDAFDYGEYLDRVLGPGSLPGVMADVSGHQTAMLEHARMMFENWLDTTVGTRT
jgi:hypothetical protein